MSKHAFSDQKRRREERAGKRQRKERLRKLTAAERAEQREAAARDAGVAEFGPGADQ